MGKYVDGFVIPPDWHTPYAENDLRVGGVFRSRMEAKDGSSGFDFVGTYDEVHQHKLIAFTMSDGRKVKVTFTDTGTSVQIVETFEAEMENPLELQKQGWQTILDNFKKHVETTS
jgi:uncharacterized protein YndB with AHSA1/START domain